MKLHGLAAAPPIPLLGGLLLVPLGGPVPFLMPPVGGAGCGSTWNLGFAILPGTVIGLNLKLQGLLFHLPTGGLKSTNGMAFTTALP